MPVFQRAGPQWHLQGHVQRHPHDPRTITLTRPVDALSPVLNGMVGQVIWDMKVTKPKKSKLEYLTVVLTPVLVSSISTNNAGGGSGAGPHSFLSGETETISLQFLQIPPALAFRDWGISRSNAVHHTSTGGGAGKVA
jgi:type VI protein secretion system component Hcp